MNTLSQNWSAFWTDTSNKRKLVLGFFLLIITLIFFSYFLNEIIEKREGIQLNDVILNSIPSLNCSILIFSIIWISVALTIYNLIKEPKLLLIFLWSYIFLCVSRVLTIGLVPLNPPKNIITLTDPLTDIFYGGKFLTKDLFYSGHTATIFLMYLTIEKKWLKLLLLISSILIGIMVLIQHVHYSIDVFAAPIFTYLVHKLGKLITLHKH